MIGRTRWVGYALLAPALTAVGFLILYPLYLVVATSFRHRHQPVVAVCL